MCEAHQCAVCESLEMKAELGLVVVDEIIQAARRFRSQRKGRELARSYKRANVACRLRKF